LGIFLLKFFRDFFSKIFGSFFLGKYFKKIEEIFFQIEFIAKLKDFIGRVFESLSQISAFWPIRGIKTKEFFSQIFFLRIECDQPEKKFHYGAHQY